MFYESVLCNFLRFIWLMSFYLLTPYSRVLPEKITVAQLAKIFSTFIKPECSLLCSQERTTGSILRKSKAMFICFWYKYTYEIKKASLYGRKVISLHFIPY
jgi:hypothetical protein